MNELGKALVKVSRVTKVLDLGPDRPQPTKKRVDRKFDALSQIKESMLSELRAIGAVTDSLSGKFAAISDDQALASLNRLESIEQTKPTLRQVGRYATLGAVAAPLAGAASNLMRGKPTLEGIGTLGKLREGVAKGIGGAITGGAVPLVRSHLDQKAEVGTLKQYLRQQEGA
jgi:hypothetical protein